MSFTVPMDFTPITDTGRETVWIECPYTSDAVQNPFKKVEIPKALLTIEIADQKKQFIEYADKWEQQTGIYGSPTKRFAHPAYKAIIDMGTIAIPMILQRMKDNPDDWFWALKQLAGGHDAAAGIDKFDDAVNAWLKWGRQNKYIS